MNTLEEARVVIQSEIDALIQLLPLLDNNFSNVLNKIVDKSRRTITTGVGKSGIAAKKLAATLTSVGICAYFMHPTDALHGDLGMVNQKDVVVAFSNSGETSEILDLVLPIAERGACLVAITGDKDSSLGYRADFTINIGNIVEAMGIIPTSSFIAMIAISDALAICAAKLWKFSDRDYARLHPSGQIGRKLAISNV